MSITYFYNESEIYYKKLSLNSIDNAIKINNKIVLKVASYRDFEIGNSIIFKVI